MINDEKYIHIINPSNQKIFDKVKVDDESILNNKLEKLKREFSSWRECNSQTRVEQLKLIAGILEENSDELAKSLVYEVGKTINEAEREVKASINAFKWYSKQDNEPIELGEYKKYALKTKIVRRPLGVIGMIIPWNFPLAVLAWKLAPAIWNGNCALIKPSQHAPITINRFITLLKGRLKYNIADVVNGEDTLGEQLAKSNMISMISATASTKAGMNIMESASNTLKKMSLQLSGNDAAIILDKCGLDNIEEIFWCSFQNAGQVCYAIKRLYVQEDIYDEFVSKYVQIAKGVVVGCGFDPNTQMGPLINSSQVEQMKLLVKDAKDNGGIVHCGGYSNKEHSNMFYPTVITNVHQGCKIVSGEQFGPIIPIIKIENLDEGIEMANAFNYGLGTSVWSEDVPRVISNIHRIDSAQVWVNTHMKTNKKAPFGGIKGSGYEVEHGMDLYCYKQTVQFQLRDMEDVN